MTKKVIFWGCGNIAKKMFQKYKDEFTLLYGISNDPEENFFIPEAGQIFRVNRPKNKIKNEEGTIVICSAEYEKIAEQLSLLGYIPFVDFIDYELAETVWSGKEIVLLYGFCHLRGIGECLKGAKLFSNRYMPVYYPNYIPLSFYQHERLRYFIQHCSVLIYGEAASAENYRKNMSILGNVKANVKVLGLHTVYFGGYFPQKKRTYNNMNEFAVKSEGYDYTPFSYGDSWLNECISKGMSLEDVFDSIENKKVYEKEFVLSYLEGEWKRLKYQEKESDFKICNYIEENFRRSRLFRNETHMENLILYQYSLQVLQYLNCISEMTIKEKPLLNCSEHFIYPCVAEILKLEWDVWQEELDLYTYSGWKKVTARDYIKDYYETCSEIRKLKMYYFLP